MREKASQKKERPHLKTFLTVSLTIHLLFFLFINLFYPDLNITPLLRRNIEVFLLPAMAETKTPIRKPRAEEPLKKQETRQADHEEKNTITPPPFQTETIATAAPPPFTPPVEEIKQEAGDRQEEKPVPEPIRQVVASVSHSETASPPKKEETVLNLKTDHSKEKNLIVAFPHHALKTLPDNENAKIPSVKEENPIALYPRSSGKPSPDNGGANTSSGEEPKPVARIQEPHPKEVNLIAPSSRSSGKPSPDNGGANTSSEEKPKPVARIQEPSHGEMVVAHPHYAENPKPSYPPEARKKGYQGIVLLRVEVLSNGKVGQIEVKNSSGYEMLDRSAISAVKQWKFTPARKGNETIAFWVNIPIKFKLQ